MQVNTTLMKNERFTNCHLTLCTHSGR